MWVKKIHTPLAFVSVHLLKMVESLIRKKKEKKKNRPRLSCSKMKVKSGKVRTEILTQEIGTYYCFLSIFTWFWICTL